MLSFSTITQAVQELVAERYPETPIYMNRVPVEFDRPSFLVELGPVEMLDASYACLELKATVVVTAFVEADDYHNSHVPDLMQRMAVVQELFAVEGRGQRHVPIPGRPARRGGLAPDGRSKCQYEGRIVIWDCPISTLHSNPRRPAPCSARKRAWWP